MEFQSYDLGNMSRGEIIEVTLKGNAANVRIMDSSNFSNYKSGRRHSYIGGNVTRSPYKVSIPHSGHWYVAIDLGGYAGRVQSSIRKLPGILPTAKQASLTSIPSLYLGQNDEPKYDDNYT